MKAPTMIPVTVITGFLGSGKTTFVNHILHENHGKKIAVIENEFGAVGIDDALVIRSQEEIFEMNNGCICCTVRGDLIRILHRLLKRKTKFDAIVIETTGLADPAPVAQTFFVDEELQDRLRLDAILTVVDAKHVLQHLDEKKADGVENEAIEQVAFADRILLNKTDLVTARQLDLVKRRLKGINASARVLECVNARVDLEEVLGIRAFDLSRVLEAEPDFLSPDAEHAHDATVTSVGITLPGECHFNRLNAWLSDLLQTKGADIFRSKGILAVAGSPDRFVFQGVHMLMSFGNSGEEGQEGGAGVRGWEESEPRVNRLVFIGRNLDEAALTASFKKCLVYPSPHALWEAAAARAKSAPTGPADPAAPVWYKAAVEYWDGQEASDDGVLGGYGSVSTIDVRDSRMFLQKAFAKPLREAEAGERTLVALDCGAGVGRVSEMLLLHHFQEVDLVEPSAHLLKAAKKRLTGRGAKPFPAAHKAVNFFECGIESFDPEPGRYDVIWVQWAMLYLTDDDSAAFLNRCAAALKPGGRIFIKENVCDIGFLVDNDDASVTRSHEYYCELFTKHAGLVLAHTAQQKGFPRQLFKVRMYALKPKD